MGKCVVLLFVLVVIATLVHEGDSWRRFRIRLPRIRIRLPRIRLRLPRLRLPRVRIRVRRLLPRIRLPRFRLPRIRVPKPPKCPELDTSNFLKEALCSVDNGVKNSGCMELCHAFGDMFEVKDYNVKCPVACQNLCNLPNLGKRGEIPSGNDDFNYYDENKDNKISSAELSNVLRVNEREVDERTLGRFFVENDLNRDGFLDREEFVKVNERENDDDTEEFLREMEEDENDQTDDNEVQDEVKRQYLDGLEQRMKDNELTEDDEAAIAQLDEATANEE